MTVGVIPPTGASGVRDTHGEDGYFEFDRPELRALVPLGAARVLDVGCGGGAVGAALKTERCCEVVGIEAFPEAAARAATRLDRVLPLDLDALDALPADAGRFDAMVFGDVLEHLRDPARLLRALLPALADDGAIVCSVPNLKHWSVLVPLLVDDAFPYADAGLLDRTHVHFFTLNELGVMLDDLGLEASRVESTTIGPPPPALDALVDAAVRCGAERDETRARLCAYQYLVVARRPRG